MKIKIVSTNQNDRERDYPVLDAWAFSRPSEKEIKLEDVKKLDLPVNEFLVLNLEVECTILEREIFTNVTSHVIWAQTSRVQNILEFEIDESIRSKANDAYFEGVRSKMIEDSKTMRQDDYRGALPIMSLTKFSTSISIRHLIKLMKYFIYLHGVMNKEKFKTKLFHNSYSEIRSVVSYFSYYDNHIADYKRPEILCESFKHTKDNARIGNFLVVSSEMPFYLASQLIRHRGLNTVNDLFNLIQSDNIIFADQLLEVRIQTTGTISMFKEVASKRNCWVAQYNIWSGFLDSVSAAVVEVALPCKSGVCPFNKDAMLRYEGADPNPPCPINCRINNLTITEDQRIKMLTMVNDDKRSTSFWDNEIFAVNCYGDLI